MKKIISIIFILSVFSIISYADFETGNTLLSKLQYSREIDPAELRLEELKDLIHGSAYIIGIYDAYDGLFFDGPESPTIGQIVDVAIKYLKQNPETRHQPATELLFKAFQEAFSEKEEEDQKGR